MTTTEKLERSKAKREKLVSRMAADRDALGKLDKEISTLEALDIRALIMEVKMPYDEVRKLIKGMTPTPAELPKVAEDTGKGGAE